jgi:hypothetical protein
MGMRSLTELMFQVATEKGMKDPAGNQNTGRKLTAGDRNGKAARCAA